MMNARVLVLPFAALLLAAPALAGGDKSKVKMDTNGDGMVSAAEHAAVSKSKFDKLDTNMDGNLTAAEVTAHHKQSGKAPMATGDWIKQKDTNGDGMISTSEHVTSAESRFAKLDANGDGNLTQAELDAGRMAATEY
jgi:Ca2+-binding EF-hand superfamily protein